MQSKPYCVLLTQCSSCLPYVGLFHKVWSTTPFSDYFVVWPDQYKCASNHIILVANIEQQPY